MMMPIIGIIVCTAIAVLPFVLFFFVSFALPLIRVLNETWLDRDWRAARRLRRKMLSFQNSKLGTSTYETPALGPTAASRFTDKPSQTAIREQGSDESVAK